MRRRVKVFLFALAALILLLGLAGWALRDRFLLAEQPTITLRADAESMARFAPRAAEPMSESTIEPASRRPDIFLISVDTLRADHLCVYGYPRDTSPAVDRVATDGVVFDLAFTTSPKTTPGLASLLTGLPVKAHGVNKLQIPLDPSIPRLPEILRYEGYARRDSAVSQLRTD